MGTTAQKLQALAGSKADIQAAINEKGVPVDGGVPLSAYGDKIRQISGAGDAYFTKSDVWDEVDLPAELKGVVIAAFSSRGEVYISPAGSVGVSGIWKFDMATKIFTKLYTTAFGWRFFETSRGEVFAGTGNVTNTGVLKLNDTRDAFTQIYTVGNHFQDSWFETSQGEVFLGSEGVLKLNDTRNGFTKVYSSTYSWNQWFETSKGDVLVSSNSSGNVGILKLKATRTGFDQIYSTGYYWNQWFETSKGDVFVSSQYSSALGILKLNNARTGFDQIYSTGYYWGHWFETSKGDVFVSSRYSSALGILKLNNARTGFDQIYTVGYDWKWNETSHGDLFASCISATTNAGIIKLNDARTGFTKVHSTAYNWNYWFEYNGDVFVSAAVGATNGHFGILKLNNTRDLFVQVGTIGYSYTGVIRECLISNVVVVPGYPIFDTEVSSYRPFIMSGVVVGNWILSSARFVKIEDSYPMEAFMPSGYAASVTPIGDTLGNVCILTSTSIIFNIKPL